MPNRVLVIAASLKDVSGTLNRLLLIELVATLSVLAAIAALGLWVVRLGLRPLREIEGTASAIAAGDLSRRVERAESTTEVGRLGLSLNAMLAQIESAFRAREASEDSSAARSRSSGASSPMPHTSCGRRWPPSGRTPSCSAAAPPPGRTIWPGRCPASRAKPSG